MNARKGTDSRMKHETRIELVLDRELVVTRKFNGPARIVFEAWTNAELVRRWWAPKKLGVEVVSCDADVRVGGKYRYVLRPRDQDPFAFSGTYKEVTPHSRLVYTQWFESIPGAEVLVTVEFEDNQDGTTLLVSRELYPSKEARDAALESGMEVGMLETLDQLDQLVASLS